LISNKRYLIFYFLFKKFLTFLLGLDVKTRLDIWKLIEKMKKDRIIFLTTHAMDEADYLSERIVVFSEGEIRCVGSSFYLKNFYGEGNRIVL
jgi:ABC-type multidrug transport system ATPase subunit